MKIAVAGKGGVGKTTLCGALARTFAAMGRRVLAVDADPDANLASSLPLDHEAAEIVPLASQKELLRKKAGMEEELPPGLFLLNPSIEDLLPAQTVTWGGGHPLLVLGWRKGGGEGCYCAENAVLKRVLQKVLLQPGELVLIDCEAGLEHLSRGTVGSIDAVLAVVEPGQRSVETAFAIRRLAEDLGIPVVYPILCGHRSHEERTKVQKSLGEWPLLAAIPYLEEIRMADLESRPPDMGGSFGDLMRRLAEQILEQRGRQRE